MKEEKKIEFKYRPDNINGDPGVQQFRIIVEMVEKANSLGLDGKKLQSLLASPHFKDTDSKTFRMTWDYDSTIVEQSMRKRRERSRQRDKWTFAADKLFFFFSVLSLVAFLGNQFLSPRSWIPGDGALVTTYVMLLFFYWDSNRLLRHAYKRENDYGDMVDQLIRIARRQFGN